MEQRMGSGLRGAQGVLRGGRSAALALTAALMTAATVLLGSAEVALASSPVDGGRVLLGFGQSYGGGSVHRGVDIAAGAGDAVRAPAGGTVAFAGAVPADGGGTAIAVTLDLADGTKVTLMPLARASVARGTAVEDGGLLGVLAEGGDSSSAETHVHLSLRRGSVYLDPAPLLAAGVPGGSGEGQPQGAGATGPATAGAPGTAPAAAHAAATSGHGAAQPRTAGSGAAVAAPSAAGLPSGVSLAPQPGSAPAVTSPSQQAAAAAGRPLSATGPQAALPTRLAAQVGAASAAGAATAAGAPAVQGVDLAALGARARASASRYARRHVRSLALGVGALLAGVAALGPLGKRAGSLGRASVRPEGEAVAAAAGR